MFQKILVPVGFASLEDPSLRIAIQLAEQNDSKLLLLHVVETVPHIAYDEMKSFYQKLEKYAHQELDKILNQYEHKNLNIQKSIVVGERVPEILRFVEDNDIDLLIINSHKIDPVKGE